MDEYEIFAMRPVGIKFMSNTDFQNSRKTCGFFILIIQGSLLCCLI